jgi:enamine deaminase RidA (YjgF/YER057c/UK114 family)
LAKVSKSIVRLTPGPRMSQGVIYGGLLYTAGHVDAQSADVGEQTKNVLAKIDALLEQAQSSKSQVLSASIWLSDIATFDDMNRAWEHWIDPHNPPARATVESRLATAEYKVEIAVIAVAGKAQCPTLS